MNFFSRYAQCKTIQTKLGELGELAVEIDSVRRSVRAGFGSLSLSCLSAA